MNVISHLCFLFTWPREWVIGLESWVRKDRLVDLKACFPECFYALFPCQTMDLAFTQT